MTFSIVSSEDWLRAKGRRPLPKSPPADGRRHVRMEAIWRLCRRKCEVVGITWNAYDVPEVAAV